MPTYQYACTQCAHQLEAVQSFSDPSLDECPECAGRLRKLYSAVGIVFKGSGFYRTDSRAASAADSAKGEAAKNDAAKSEAGKSEAGKSDAGKADSTGKNGSAKSDSTSSSSTSSDSSSSSSTKTKAASPAGAA